MKSKVLYGRLICFCLYDVIQHHNYDLAPATATSLTEMCFQIFNYNIMNNLFRQMRLHTSPQGVARIVFLIRLTYLNVLGPQVVLEKLFTLCHVICRNPKRTRRNFREVSSRVYLVASVGHIPPYGKTLY